jgi:hypothetical protein
MTVSKLLRFVAGVFLLFASVAGVRAIENRDADHAALRALRDKVTQALSRQDVQALTDCCAKEFAFTTSVDQTILTTPAQVAAYFDRVFRASDALVATMKTEAQADILTRFIDEHTGVCYGSAIDTYTLKSGKEAKLNVRWSATVLKEDGQWKIAVVHAGVNVLDNPILANAVTSSRRVAILAAPIALLLGLILGVIIQGRRPKAKA